ncbi:lipopolysaccharide biosynthesis protein [Legionella parisiensis]|uniref:Uncharacterized protein n=1 Tax=Legionella parisiensis TaxID=45071 RepID=A0A1E5JUR6_9GAMM|nr:oligosaccharide flippase family protein [Legionella parisiensis]KTD43142.1 Polysaccharide biosynthesis protein [Legionella parisiensis]OEH48261.1 hypothetical protein lpari_00753 [Legionella parisiensis]STX77779.1 Polysaccharide biosynthesis protein [Legionella parisiensis]
MKEHKEINKLVLNESSVLIVIVLGTFLQFVANIQFARILEPSVFGDFILALQILNFLRPLNQIGLLYSITYYVPHYIENSAFGYLRGFLKWMWKRYLILSIIIISLGIIVAIGAYHFFANNVNMQQHNSLVFYLIWLVPLRTLAAFQKNLLDANYNYIWGTLPSQIIAYLMLNTFLAVIYHTITKQPIYWVIGAYTASVLIAIIIQYMGLLRNLYKKFSEYAPVYSIKEWKSKGNRMFLMGSVLSSINMMDMLMLKILGDDPNELGTLAVIFALLLPLVILNQAIKVVITPLISALIKEKNYTKLQKILNVTNLYKLVYLVITTFILLYYGKNLLELFGTGYSKFYSPLIIAILGALFYAVFDFSSFLLLYGDTEVIANKIVIFQLIAVIVLDIALIPTYQLIGAVWGITLSTILSTCASIYYARKSFPVKTLFII